VSGYPEPPYFLLIASLLASLAAGKAFEVSLKQLVEQWQKNRQSSLPRNLNNTNLALPFLGISGGICMFLSSGLTIFGFPALLSIILSTLLTIGTATLVWSQLGKLLSLLQQGGSRAIDLDALDAPE
jgi:hypothetical protein